MRALLLVFSAGLLFAAAPNQTAPPFAIESTLTLYKWLGDRGAMARVEESCNGTNEAEAHDRAIHDLRREEAIRLALERQLGGSSKREEQDDTVHPTCGKGLVSHYWRDQYETTLRTLEVRLGLKSKLLVSAPLP
jgi:hypothetical protein